MSLMNTMNNIGCGTPDNSGAWIGFAQPTTTYWLLLDAYIPELRVKL